MVSKLLRGHQDSVYDIAWTPDGSRLASAGRDGTLRLWNSSGSQIDQFDLGEPVTKVAFSHNGQLLATGTNNGRVEVRESASLSIVFQHSLSSVDSLAFLDKARMLLIGSAKSGLVQGWSLEGDLMFSM